jgi:hypothetical protein
MNITLKNLRWFGQSERASLNTQADQTASGSTCQRDNALGSYGRGSYAGHRTYALDFRTEGSYGRGSYAGYSTAALDFSGQGGYGRGSYAGCSTADLDFDPQGSLPAARR